jgi:mycothiol synthase
MMPLVETSPSIARVSVADDAAALELATQAWPETERAGHLAELADLVRAGRAGELFLLASRQASELSAAMLAQLLPGDAAVVWRPQFRTVADAGLSMLYLGAMHRELASAGALLAQSLLDPSGSGDLLETAGYVFAGKLLYMVASDAGADGGGPTDLELEPYSPANHQRLASTIERTYRGSLDCPLVDGLRPIESVLAGYRGAGESWPWGWFLLREQGQDVGCLLLADHPRQAQLEIVYLGVVPEVRGRGLGRKLALAAISSARLVGRERVVLAVDAANEPAVSAYRRVGFVAWDERALWIKRLTRQEFVHASAMPCSPTPCVSPSE